MYGVTGDKRGGAPRSRSAKVDKASATSGDAGDTRSNARTRPFDAYGLTGRGREHFRALVLLVENSAVDVAPAGKMAAPELGMAARNESEWKDQKEFNRIRRRRESLEQWK
jgi:hypothetical protein